MINIVTYSSETAKPEHRWVGYIVLANGDYLGVMFRAASEDAVKAKAAQFWETESKRPINQVTDVVSQQRKGCMETGDVSGLVDSGRGHHFAGKVWMRNKETRELVRVPAEQLQQMLDSGYEKSGPRAK